jgi:hypothetical protein
MSQLESIKAAIENRTPISFNYIRKDKDPGLRVGDPHAAFIRRLKSGEERVYLDLFQTDGVTDSGVKDSDSELPGWRKFFLNDVQNVQFIKEKAPFKIAEGYNPTSYEFPIAKV